MGKTLQRGEGHFRRFRIDRLHGRRQRRQLFVHQLVQQRVGFRGHPHCDVVVAGHRCGGQQIGHGFPHARARFHYQIRALVKGRPHRLGHLLLLGARLEFGVNAR